MTEPLPGTTAHRLYSLLPAIHRTRDAETGGALADLLAVIATQLDVLSEELDQLSDDEFIETASPWVVPYLGDLVSTTLSTVSSRGSARRGPRSPTRSAIGVARAPRPSWSRWLVTSPDGPRASSSRSRRSPRLST